MWMNYFLGTVEDLVCHKMCSKTFENPMTNKKKLSKTFEEGFPAQKKKKKKHQREVNISTKKN